MIRSLIISLLLFIGYGSYAQTVEYTYKALAAEGCQMTFSVAKQDNSYYIIATIKSDRMIFLDKPTMLIKTFDDVIIKLTGEKIGNNSTSTASVIVGNIAIPFTDISTTAQFSITEKQLEQLNKGVAKIRISTTPIEHERTFKKDKIGKELYKLYIKQKNKDDSF